MFELREDEGRLLLNIALMATGQNRLKSAATILAAIERFRPDSESIGVAKAVMLISAQQFAECVSYIDEVALEKWPDSAMLRAFRGMALIRMGRRDEATACLFEAAASTADPAAANLAKGLLTEGI